MNWVFVAVVVGVIVVAALAVRFLSQIVLPLFGIISVPEDSTAIITKKFTLRKDNLLPDGHIIALKGEPGIQADMLPPGLYFGYFPWQFSFELQKFTTVPQGKIGLIESRDGAPLANGRILAKTVECDSFQDTRGFLTKGGQRGPQGDFARPGTYRINTKLFTVTLVPAIQIPDDKIGIVTTKDGAPLPVGEIAGPEVPGHDGFQNVEAFVTNGGNKGLQRGVLLAGTHYINPMFATVELQDLVEIGIGHVGVVVSYVGTNSQAQVAGAPNQSPLHGRIVDEGEKGVWRKPLDPGKYPMNLQTHFVESVPTTNIVLNWAEAKTEAHKLDEKLSTITVRSKDGFAFNLDVSQIIHVPRDKASAVIARFGSMQNLVTQVLEPLIGNYFRNSAQAYDATDFLLGRAERQNEAKAAIQAAIAGHDVEAVDTLIGDINPPADLMKPLTDRQVAEKQKATFMAQKEAQVARTELEQTTAEANTRGQVVQAARNVEVAELDAQSRVKRAEGDKKAAILTAEGEAQATTLTGEAKAGVIQKVGAAEAEVQRLKVESIGGGNYASIQIATAFADHGIALVPEILVSGGGEGAGNGGLVNAFLGNLMRDELRKREADTTAPTAQPAAVEPTAAS